MDITTAVFDQLSSFFMGKGMNSSGPFANFGQEPSGLTRETRHKATGLPRLALLSQELAEAGEGLRASQDKGK